MVPAVLVAAVVVPLEVRRAAPEVPDKVQQLEHLANLREHFIPAVAAVVVTMSPYFQMVSAVAPVVLMVQMALLGKMNLIAQTSRALAVLAVVVLAVVPLKVVMPVL